MIQITKDDVRLLKRAKKVLWDGRHGCDRDYTSEYVCNAILFHAPKNANELVTATKLAYKIDKLIKASVPKSFHQDVVREGVQAFLIYRGIVFPSDMPDTVLQDYRRRFIDYLIAQEAV
jgi:hypothetical protein